MIRRRINPSIIPNLFTAANMFCGFLSIVNASNGKYFTAAWLIILAAVFDALDGFMARLTRSSSELGVELDSLSDVVSFGAAPAYLIYHSYLFQYEAIGIILSSCLMLFGGYRLARFNVELVGFDKDYFQGLPIPASGLTISAFTLAYYEADIGFPPPYNFFIIPLVILLSLIMISRVKYDSTPKLSLKAIKEKPFPIIIIAASIIALIITGGKALFYIFILMIFFGIFRQIFTKYLKKS